ncbi:LysR family transcriptional regulator [Priestia endophytica]|uniref:LysR family transcriptional regulator, repressor for citA n=1 Tax=Priestia endophytica DSM 13796 TaxID=1121089 RepID=A0A1I6BJM7_9BACI|nr:LysR family transcriptional regulator [Priestia endophytica]KYG25653.1 hypothetical protein AZF06_17690 [Priestia endophytica]SFQ81148.1 LysR family transcriptional regulator, repressor for citA [Priestia endophytica DSM 13796]
MDMKWIETFLVAAKYENFRKTSELLFLSQPTVTAHIKHLEQELGASFFKRSGRHVYLTEAGRRFVPHAEKLAESYYDGVQTLESFKQGFQRKITVAVAPYIASAILPRFLSSFLHRYPKIEVMINVVKSMEISGEIESGRADVGLSRMPVSHVICKSILQDSVILAAPPSSENESLFSLFQQHRLLINNHPLYWEEILPSIQQTYKGVKTMVVNQVEITKRFIEEGLGMSFLPFSVVEREVKKGKIDAVHFSTFPLPVSNIYVAYRRETEDVLTFIDTLQQFINGVD